MMESINKLRHHAHVLKGGSTDYNELFEIADEIEAEIAEQFMELPLDADGVPICVGDYLQLGETHGEVVALTYCPDNNNLPWEWQCDTGDWYNTAFAHHIKPRTLEDVLEDFELNVLNYGRKWELDDAQTAITECAAEIRELLGVGE